MIFEVYTVQTAPDVVLLLHFGKTVLLEHDLWLVFILSLMLINGRVRWCNIALQ